MSTFLLLIALSLPPQYLMDTIQNGSVRGKKACLWRGERLTCYLVTHGVEAYSIATQEGGAIRYILTIRGGKIQEVWSHDSKEA